MESVVMLACLHSKMYRMSTITSQSLLGFFQMGLDSKKLEFQIPSKYYFCVFATSTVVAADGRGTYVSYLL